MIIMKKYKILLLAFVLVSLAGAARFIFAGASADFGETESRKKEITAELAFSELAAVIGEIDSLPSILLRGKYLLYDIATSRLLEQESFTYARYLGEVYTATGYIEQLSTPDHFALVDNRLTTIHVQKHGEPTEAAKGFSLLNQLKTQLQVTEGSRYTLEERAGEMILEIIPDSNTMLKPVEIIYDADTKHLRSAVTTTTVLVPSNDENSTKIVSLKMIVDEFNDSTGHEIIKGLTGKIKWSKERIEVTGSWKTYSINYAD